MGKNDLSYFVGKEAISIRLLKVKIKNYNLYTKQKEFHGFEITQFVEIMGTLFSNPLHDAPLDLLKGSQYPWTQLNFCPAEKICLSWT